MEVNNQQFAWLVAYIDSAHISTVKRDLAKYPEFHEVEAFIPTVKILKKTFKQKDIFDDVPLLFNYGFFKVPRRHAVYFAYLEKMQQNISCIFAWVKDPSKKLSAIEKIIAADEMDEHSISDYLIPCATATPQEVSKLVLESLNQTAHGADDLKLIQPGDMITLMGYPFENIQAEVLSIDEKRQKVNVSMMFFGVMKKVEVSYDNVFFTMYHRNSHDDTLSNNSSLDEMQTNRKLDKFTFNQKKDGNNS